MFGKRTTILPFVVCALFSCGLMINGQPDGTDSKVTTPPCDPPAEVGSPYTFSYVINDTFTDGVTFRSNHSELGMTNLAFCAPPTDKCLNYISGQFVATIEVKDDTSYSISLTILNVTTPRDEADWIQNVGEGREELGRCRLQFYSLPQVSLSNCPNDSDANSGYIKAGTSPPCSCQVIDAGVPPGIARWLSDPDGRVLTEGDNSIEPAILNAAFNSSDPEPRFVCRGTSSRGSGLDIVYMPEFAYGPDKVEISIENDMYVYTMCPESSSSPTTNHRTIEIYCDIRSNSATPGFSMKLMVGKTEQHQISTEKKGTNSATDRYIFHVELPKEGEVIKPECVATNLIFSDVVAKDMAEIVVNAPPPRSPVLTIINNNIRGKTPSIVRYGGDVINSSSSSNSSDINPFVYSMTSDEMREIICIVEGGYPAPDSTKVECAGETTLSHTTSGYVSSVGVFVSRDMNATMCSCSVDHSAGCYSAKTEVILDVQYPTTIEDFTFTNNQSVPEIKAGMSVTLACRATGNPLPRLSIESASKRTTSKVLLQLQEGQSHAIVKETQGNGWREIRINKVFECRDTDVYTCSIGNGIQANSSVKKSFSITVICPPELQQLNATNIQPSLSQNNRLTYDIPILGHPKPYQLTLTRESQCPTEVTNGSTLNFVGVNPSLFELVFLPGNTPHGIVRLEMTPALSLDVGIYRLIVANGIRPDLEYTFYHGAKDDDASPDDDDDGFLLIIAVIVAVIAVIITNVIVAIVCFLMGKKSERCHQTEKREPKVLYVPSPDYQDGESSPLPGAYSNIDFVRLDDPAILSTSSDDLQQHESVTMTIQPPPRPSPLRPRIATTTTAAAASATISVTTISSSASPTNILTTSTAQRQNHPVHNNRHNHAIPEPQRTYSAQTPPGNFYTYDLPKKTQNAAYANSPNTADKRHHKQIENNSAPNYKNHSNLAVKNKSKKDIKSKAKINDKLPLPLDSNNADHTYYQEITDPATVYYSESSENVPNSDNNIMHYQIPPRLPRSSPLPINEPHYVDDVKKIRNVSNTSDDTYQQIDVNAQSEAHTITNNGNSVRSSDNALQRLNSRPDNLSLRYSHKSDNSYYHSDNESNSSKSRDEGNDSNDRNVKDNNFSKLRSGTNNVEPNIYSEVSQKYEVSSSLFSDNHLLDDKDNNKIQGRQPRPNLPSTPIYAEPSSNAGRESEYEISDGERLYTNSTNNLNTMDNSLGGEHPYVDSHISPKYEDASSIFSDNKRVEYTNSERKGNDEVSPKYEDASSVFNYSGSLENRNNEKENCDTSSTDLNTPIYAQPSRSKGKESEYEICDSDRQQNGLQTSPRTSSLSHNENVANPHNDRDQESNDTNHYVLHSPEQNTNGRVGDLGPTYANTDSDAHEQHTGNSMQNDSSSSNSKDARGKRVDILVENNNNGKSNTGAYEQVDINF